MDTKQLIELLREEYEHLNTQPFIKIAELITALDSQRNFSDFDYTQLRHHFDIGSEVLDRVSAHIAPAAGDRAGSGGEARVLHPLAPQQPESPSPALDPSQQDNLQAIPEGVLSPLQEATRKVMEHRGPDEALTGRGIVDELGKRGTDTDEATLRTHVIPALKKHCGLTNLRNGRGYFTRPEYRRRGSSNKHRD